MDSHVPEDAASAFTTILQDIYRQTSAHMDPENEQAALYSETSPPLSDYFSPPDETDTYRYEPLLDPALSYINDILGDADVPAGNDPSFSYGELVAYQAKASELAAIVKEDSPSLGLHVNVTTSQEDPRLALDVDATSQESYYPFSSDPRITLANEPHHLQQEPHFIDVEPYLWSSHVPEPHPNALLLSSLRGPQAKFPPPLGIPIPVFDVSAPQETSAMMGMQRTEKAGAEADIGASSHTHKPHKVPKSVTALKPRKECATSRKRRRSKGQVPEYVDMNDLLFQCANAIGANNIKSAIEILTKVKQHASPFGNGAQRLAYYFSEALDARFSGMGWPLYMGRVRQRPSSAEILKATCKYMSTCPFAKASHYFINQTILNVSNNASVLHILELQTTGFQYPSLLNALAKRPGGPPQVRLTGVGFPHYSMIPAQTDVVLEGLQKVGRQLSEYAASVGVPFHYTPWAGSRETLRMQDFVSPDRNPEEVFVVISAYLLRYIMDDTLDPPPVRQKLLKMGRDMNPDVYIQGIVTGSYSTPFFTRRFREALFHFESVYDMLDTFIERENGDRLVFESEILGKAILNIVACEGIDVVERVDKYKNWQALTEEVGFEQLPLDEKIKGNIQTMLKSWHKEYTVGEDSQYLLMGWKGRMLHAMSAWKASASESLSN